MTEQTQPTDAELLDAADDFRSQYKHGGTTFDEFDALGFARAVLAKWGTPPAVAGEPVAYRYKFKEDLQWQYTCNKSQAHRLAVVEPLYTTPQPTQAQAGAVPLAPFISAQRERLYYNRPENVGKGASLADWHRIVQYIEAAHGIGIKGGQS